MDKDLLRTIGFWDEVELGASLEYSQQILNACTDGASLNNRYILDVGCGTGVYSILFCQRQANVIGMDFSLNSLRIAQRQLKRQSCKNTYFIQSDVRLLPIKGKFDIIWSFGCLCYVKNPFKVMDKLIDLLNDNGLLIVSLEKYSGVAIFLNSIRKLLYLLPQLFWRFLADIITFLFLGRAILFGKKERKYVNLRNLILGQFCPIKCFVTKEDIKRYIQNSKVKLIKIIDFGRTFAFVARKD